MLTPKERLNTEEHHLGVNSVQVTKVAKASAINHFEQVMDAPLLKEKTKESMSKLRFFETVNSDKKQRPSRESEETSNDAELIKPERSPLNGKTELSNHLPMMPSAKLKIDSSVDETDSKQATSSHHAQDSNLTQTATPNLSLQQVQEQLKADARIPVNESSQNQDNRVSERPISILKQETISKQQKNELSTQENVPAHIKNSVFTQTATPNLSLQQVQEQLKADARIPVNEFSQNQDNRVSERPISILKQKTISKQQKNELLTQEKVPAHIKNSAFTQPATPNLSLQQGQEQLKTDGQILLHTKPTNATQRLVSSQDSVQLVKATLMVTRDTRPLSLNEVSSAQSVTRQSKPINNEPSLDPTNEMHKGDKSKEELPIPHQISIQPNNTPGQIILANLKTAEPMNHQLHNLVRQLVDKVQLLVPSLGSQNRIQLVLEQGQLKGTEITITLQNNQLNVALVHSNQHAELLQQVRPELLERLQRINIDQQVRVTTTSHEQAAQNAHQEQGQQHESSQKSRVIDLWLEEQENA